ncbi:MAG: hypothetical protein ABSG90_11445 [Dehalococcoidia bacterium]|jgi:hypothetical protein
MINYRVGNRESCGHRHRSIATARRCAASYLNRREIAREAREIGIPFRQYYREAIDAQITVDDHES